MITYMPITITTLIIIAFFTSPESGRDYSNLEHVARAEQVVEVVEEKEEYIVEDYADGLYEENDCQDCLRSAATDECFEFEECVTTSECSDWIDCVGWCDAYNNGSDCYENCDRMYVKSKKTNSELNNCVCNRCSLKCRRLC